MKIFLKLKKLVNRIYLLIILLLCSSCIPTRIAPKIKDYKIQVGKRFRKTLPKTKLFIFNDPKDENEFYDYIDIKYKLNQVNVEDQVPVILKGHTFYLSFYEASIPTKHVNVAKVAMDITLQAKDYDPIFEGNYSKRNDSWYIALKIEDSDFKNCLEVNHSSYEIVKAYLKRLKDEYLKTHIYEEIHFRKTKIEDF